jgi:hypothetical protein
VLGLIALAYLKSNKPAAINEVATIHG